MTFEQFEARIHWTLQSGFNPFQVTDAAERLAGEAGAVLDEINQFDRVPDPAECQRIVTGLLVAAALLTAATQRHYGMSCYYALDHLAGRALVDAERKARFAAEKQIADGEVSHG